MFLITLLLLGANKIGVAISPEATYVYVDPRNVNATDQPIGYKFPIDVNITGAPHAFGWQSDVTWDPNVLSVFLVQEGEFLRRGGDYVTALQYYPKDLALASQWGNITVACVLYGGGDNPIEKWATGDGWEFRLGFEVKATGSTVIGLSGTGLLDRMESGIPAPTYYPNFDGFFFNAPFHDIAVTDIVASPAEVRAGEPVSINVTLTNEGNYTDTSDVAVYADTVPRDLVDPDKVLLGANVTVGTQSATNLDPGSSTTLLFTWNTVGVEDGNYTISAKSLLSDNDTGDNIFFDGKVTVKPPALLHDIAIISVVPSPTEVGVGQDVTISIDVKNEGNFTETFNVTAYADLDTMVMRDEITIGTENDVALANGTSTTLTITWNTTGVSVGVYTISAEVPPVPEEREADKADNIKVDDTVTVKQEQGGPDYTWYAVGIIVIIVVVAVVVYLVRFRK